MMPFVDSLTNFPATTDEGDEYASDFQSTDDEAGGDEMDAGEKQLQQEAREARKVDIMYGTSKV